MLHSLSMGEIFVVMIDHFESKKAKVCGRCPLAKNGNCLPAELENALERTPDYQVAKGVGLEMHGIPQNCPNGYKNEPPAQLIR